uniref:Uncharacterized protein n=1 Tax=Cacopsylla melanoneura TaxID=428564 RepID=A0A8D8UFS3_9HEMI
MNALWKSTKDSLVISLNGSSVPCPGFSHARPTTHCPEFRRNWKNIAPTAANTSLPVSNRKPNWRPTSIRCKPSYVCPTDRRTCQPKGKWCPILPMRGKVWKPRRNRSRNGFCPR